MQMIASSRSRLPIIGSDAAATKYPSAGAGMRVGVDTTGIYTTNAGVARYVRGLLRGLAQTDGHRAFELGWPVENLSYSQPMRTLKTCYREFIWGKLLAPRTLAREDAQILHSTSGMFIRVPRGTRHVLTLHDMSISRHPERFRRWQVYSWNRRLPAVNAADRVIAISRFTADESMALLGVPASKIDVVHNGCDFSPDAPPPPESAPANVPGEFFLFVGSLEPGKNLKLLKAAYEFAADNGIRLPPLVIVGARWLGVPSEGPKPRDWIYLGRQSDECLIWLYRRALALVFPSIYEGFGFPPIEAMALRCPVVCSATSSLPEVTGGAALMTELTPPAYAHALARVASEPALRDELIEKGVVNSRRFTWSRCAAETVEVYRNCLSASA